MIHALPAPETSPPFRLQQTAGSVACAPLPPYRRQSAPFRGSGRPPHTERSPSSGCPVARPRPRPGSRPPRRSNRARNCRPRAARSGPRWCMRLARALSASMSQRFSRPDPGAPTSPTRDRFRLPLPVLRRDRPGTLPAGRPRSAPSRCRSDPRDAGSLRSACSTAPRMARPRPGPLGLDVGVRGSPPEDQAAATEPSRCRPGASRFAGEVRWGWTVMRSLAPRWDLPAPRSNVAGPRRPQCDGVLRLR